MRNMLALIGLIVVLFFGLGWYFQWYTFVLHPGENGQRRIELNVNTNKIVDDTKSGVSTVGEIIKERTPDASTVTSTAETAPATTPVRFEDLPSFFRPSNPPDGNPKVFSPR